LIDFREKTASIESDARKSDEESQSNEKKFNFNFDFKVKVTFSFNFNTFSSVFKVKVLPLVSFLSYKNSELNISFFSIEN
jgi:hypothetical protein